MGELENVSILEAECSSVDNSVSDTTVHGVNEESEMDEDMIAFFKQTLEHRRQSNFFRFRRMLPKLRPHIFERYFS